MWDEIKEIGKYIRRSCNNNNNNNNNTRGVVVYMATANLKRKPRLSIVNKNNNYMFICVGCVVRVSVVTSFQVCDCHEVRKRLPNLKVSSLDA